MPQLPDSVPQIQESRLSGDYINEYAIWMSYDLEDADQAKDWTDWVIQDAEGFMKRGYVLKKYEGRFPDTKFAGAVREDNENKVALLDAIVLEIQNRFDKEIVPLVAKYKEGLLMDQDQEIIHAFVLYMVSTMKRVGNILHLGTLHQKNQKTR